jgi:hypothetical protein
MSTEHLYEFIIIGPMTGGTSIFNTYDPWAENGETRKMMNGFLAIVDYYNFADEFIHREDFLDVALKDYKEFNIPKKLEFDTDAEIGVFTKKNKKGME